MNMAAVVLSALLLSQDADDKKLGGLIRDLGAEEYSVRERAESELLKLGDAAIPALRDALDDKDPERALRAHRVLQDLRKERQSDQERSRAWTAYRDFDRGITFKSHPDGKVELTVLEPDTDSGKREPRTYRADSLEEFKKKYPELASKYDVDNLAPKEKWSFFNDLEDPWETLKRRFDTEGLWDKDAFGKLVTPWFPFGFNALDTWVRDQKKRFEEFRRTEPLAQDKARSEASGRPRLGIIVERIGHSLSDQLGLGPDEGILITEVKPSSPAERAGLRRHDILIKVNGNTVTGPDELRGHVEAGLKNGMEFEILRRGKREAVKVEPAQATSK